MNEWGNAAWIQKQEERIKTDNKTDADTFAEVTNKDFAKVGTRAVIPPSEEIDPLADVDW
jgi:hypothetical protein